MAVGINQNNKDLEDVIQDLLRRIAKLEKPITIHVGPVGGIIIGGTGGWTLSVDTTGNLVATRDDGAGPTVLAP